MRTEIVKVGEKGQITLPVDIREKEKVGKGTLFEVNYLGNGNIILSKSDKKQELRLALKMLGKGLEEKGYNTEKKIVELCKKVRKEVYYEKVKGAG